MTAAAERPDHGSSSGCVVEMSTISVDGRDAVICSAACNPLSPGIRRSISTR